MPIETNEKFIELEAVKPLVMHDNEMVRPEPSYHVKGMFLFVVTTNLFIVMCIDLERHLIPIDFINSKAKVPAYCFSIDISIPNLKSYVGDIQPSIFCLCITYIQSFRQNFEQTIVI